MNLKYPSVTSFKAKKANNFEITACLAQNISFAKTCSHLKDMIQI